MLSREQTCTHAFTCTDFSGDCTNLKDYECDVFSVSVPSQGVNEFRRSGESATIGRSVSTSPWSASAVSPKCYICIYLFDICLFHDPPAELSALLENKDLRATPYCRLAGGRTFAVLGETPSAPLVS